MDFSSSTSPRKAGKPTFSSNNTNYEDPGKRSGTSREVIDTVQMVGDYYLAPYFPGIKG